MDDNIHNLLFRIITSLVLIVDSHLFPQASNVPGVQEQVNISNFTAMDSLEICKNVENCYVCYHQVLIRKIIELHDKYMTYVTDCFQNHTLFHKVCVGIPKFLRWIMFNHFI